MKCYFIHKIRAYSYTWVKMLKENQGRLSETKGRSLEGERDHQVQSSRITWVRTKGKPLDLAMWKLFGKSQLNFQVLF